MDDDVGQIRKKLASNAFYLSLDYVAISVLSLLFWLAAGKFLSPSQYGVASTSINLIALLSGLSGLGLSIALVKLIPEYLQKNQANKAKELIKFSLAITLISGLIIGILFLVFSPLVNKSLGMPFYILILIPVIIVISSLSQIVFSILTGYQNMRGLFLTDTISHSSKVVVSVILMALGFGYLGPIGGFGIGLLLVLLLRSSLLPKLDASTRKLDKRNVLFGYAFPSFIVTISTLLLTNGQITILGFTQDTSVTGVFSVAFILSNILVMMFRITSRSLFPITSQLSVKKKNEEIQGYFINMVVRYGLLASVPILIFFVLFSDNLILAFSSREYLAASSLIPVLSFAAILYGIGIVFNTSVYAIGKPKVQRNIAIFSSIFFLVLALPLTYLFSAKGMAYSYLTYSLITLGLGFYNIRKYIKIELPINDISKIIIAGLISFLLLLATSPMTDNIMAKLLFIIASNLIYMGILTALKFVTTDDIKLLRFLANKVPVKNQLNYIINKIPRRE